METLGLIFMETKGIYYLWRWFLSMHLSISLIGFEVPSEGNDTTIFA